jgi:bifunctional non-homologous end joining protein LigD
LKTREHTDLDEYRLRRHGGRTPEPMGGAAVRGRRFVVQHHLARRAHFDLRLEHEGVLLCWAIPKGPSADPADKRLAVQTEPHPLRYTNFEGVIPEGNYGAGAMIVWDQGSYTPLLDMSEGLETGKLLFALHGHKLFGNWTLVRTRADWLLIKERDAYIRTGTDNAFPADSILSGLTAEERREPEAVARHLTDRLTHSGAVRLQETLQVRGPMLATPHEGFSDPDWVFELKHDGYRAFAIRKGEDVRLRSRNGLELGPAFPDLTHPIEHLPFPSFVIDGEIVCTDGTGRGSFARLQARARLNHAHEQQVAALSAPATFYAFDLLEASGYDCRNLPLVERKQLLQSMLPSIGPCRYNDHLEGQGETLLAFASEHGLEGIVAKRAGSPYRSGRSGDWRKTALTATEDFVVAGWVPSDKAGRHITALLLASYVQGRLVYSGRVGTGFSTSDEGNLLAKLRELPSAQAPDNPPDEPGARWVAPRLVVEVRFKQRTMNGLLRMPVFLRERPDKAPAECGESIVLPDPERRDFAISNPDKILWPGENLTKADLADYYERMAPFILPHLRDRAVTLVRFPDGIEGESFFQKHAPASAPAWLRADASGADTQLDPDLIVIDSVDALRYVANLAAVELHMRSGTLTQPDRPSWLVIDLDPKEAPFGWVIDAARCLLTICGEIGLPAYLKTTGSTGLHLMLPTGGELDHEQGTVLTTLIATAAVREQPATTTLERRIENRAGKVYLDCGQNRAGQTIAAPFSLRARPGAPVSMPIRRRELTGRLTNGRFHLQNASRRMSQLRHDPLLPLAAERVDFLRTAAALERRLTDSQ